MVVRWSLLEGLIVKNRVISIEEWQNYLKEKSSTQRAIRLLNLAALRNPDLLDKIERLLESIVEK